MRPQIWCLSGMVAKNATPLARRNTVLLLVVVALIYFYRDRVIGCDVMEPGGTLYLRHEAVDTVRGRFCYASDCRLIAELMSEVERASWYCY